MVSPARGLSPKTFVDWQAAARKRPAAATANPGAGEAAKANATPKVPKLRTGSRAAVATAAAAADEHEVCVTRPAEAKKRGSAPIGTMMSTKIDDNG